MLDTENTNIEIYREAIGVLDDIKNSDSQWEDRFPAVAATILYQLLDAQERRNRR